MRDTLFLKMHATSWCEAHLLRLAPTVPFGSSAVLESFVASLEGVAEEARTRGFPSLPFGGFGFVGVASDLSIVAAWRIGSGSPMSDLGR